ncbi:MAG: hypothetical protein L0H35_06335, partial [Psychrobacter sp.]|nr:hypothetical protein [Psychrobacter sp.]
ACMGTSQLGKTLDCYLAPEKFESYYKQGYTLKQYAHWIDLIVPSSGTLKEFNLLKEVKKLPSFYCANITVKSGDYLSRTVDLYTSPGDVYFIHDNLQQLEVDSLQFRELEKDCYVFG